MQKYLIRSLQALLIILLLLLLGLQIVIIPLMAEEYALMFPEVDYLKVPFTILLDLVLLCVQVIILAVFPLLSMVEKDRIFSEKSFKYVSVIIGSLTVMGTILLGILLYLNYFLQANPPGVAIGLALGILVSFASAILMAVMQGLLKKAYDLKKDMEAVI